MNALLCKVLGCIPILSPHQGYQLAGNVPDRRVNERDVELVARGQLDTRRLQPTAHRLRRLSVPADKAAFQLLPRRRGHEDQERTGDRGPDLPGARDVDLQQSWLP